MFERVRVAKLILVMNAITRCFVGGAGSCAESRGLSLQSFHHFVIASHYSQAVFKFPVYCFDSALPVRDGTLSAMEGVSLILDGTSLAIDDASLVHFLLSGSYFCSVSAVKFFDAKTAEAKTA